MAEWNQRITYAPRSGGARWHSILPRNGCQEQLGSITIIIDVIQSCATEGIIRVMINQTWSISCPMGEAYFYGLNKHCLHEADFVCSMIPRFHSPTSNNTLAPCLWSMYNIFNQNRLQLLLYAASSSPWQQLSAENQPAAASSANVLSNLCIKGKKIANFTSRVEIQK